MDWATRNVLSWRLSNTMPASFCVEALEEAMDKYGPPKIMNTGHGSPFTGADWISFYNTERPHSALEHRTPEEAYWANEKQKQAA